MTRILAMIPTWNESENIGPLLDALLAVDPRLEALVVDDNSPDGTWRLVAERAAAEPRVHLLHRTRDKGRGLAGIAGFREAVRLGADWVVEMDADWSHDPKWIPDMLAASRAGGGAADVVIGSRMVPGGGEAGRHAARGVITWGANTYIRIMLGLPVRDATSGFRLFSRASLESLPWEAMRARGPEVVQEVLLAAHRRGFAIAEVPILFVERRHGVSTFNWKIMLHSLAAMARLRFRPGALDPAQGEGRPSRLPLLLAIPLSWLYGAGRLMDQALKRARRRTLPMPVISVGNLTVGGTGKTPFTAMLARELVAQGRRPAIVSRGYGAVEPPRMPLLVSDGTRRLADAHQAGDEPCLLADAAPGAGVVVSPDRHAGALLAIEQLGADMIILDDGFQHDQLARTFDIVLWDARDRPSRARMLPAGRLREPCRALRRAQAIVITHAEYLPPTLRALRLQKLLVELKQIAPGVAVFEVAGALSGWRALGGADSGAEDTGPPWRERSVVVASGLARPEGFETMLQVDGARIVRRLRYADHHAYTQQDLLVWQRVLENQRAETGEEAVIVVTEKDAVKLTNLDPSSLPIFSAKLSIAVTEPERWHKLLMAHLPGCNTFSN